MKQTALLDSRDAERLFSSTLKSLLVVVLVLISVCSALRYAEYKRSSSYITDALQTLKSVKKRLFNSPRSYAVAKRRSRRNRTCREMYEYCVAWNARADQKCCERSQVCKCNVLFRNCRCEPKVFNWHSWW